MTILTLRMVTLRADTSMVQPLIETFSITCPGSRAMMHPDECSTTPGEMPVFDASG
jgi:hypothetical protein